MVAVPGHVSAEDVLQNATVLKALLISVPDKVPGGLLLGTAVDTYYQRCGLYSFLGAAASVSGSSAPRTLWARDQGWLLKSLVSYVRCASRTE